MRILLVHTRYQTRAGEDECFDAERRLLQDAGMEVETYEDDNCRVDDIGHLHTALSTVWSRGAHRAITERIRGRAFDVVHVHNFFPLLSPAIHHAARAEGAAVVQTLHNYRLVCPSAILYRDGHVCEDCLGKSVAWPGIVHACYRSSRPGSAAIAAMLASHRLIGTWRRKVDAYIALNEFGRRKFIEGGLPGERIAVKPNFVSPDPGPGDGSGDFALYAGRLTREKGIEVLLDAWKRLGARIPLKIMGAGPMTNTVERAARCIPNVEYLGRRPLADVVEHLGRARLFVFPSVWYEGFPRTIVECYARGVPIVASAIGPIGEVVRDGRTGFGVRPGDASDLVAKVDQMLDRPDDLAAMRVAARAEFEAHYTAEANRELLLAIYARALETRRTAAD